MTHALIKVIDGERCRFCRKCGEWWPDTEEFFYRSVRGGLRSPCKACIAEKKQQTNATKPCCVPGCNNPRYQRKSGVYDHRCWEHRYWKHVGKAKREARKAGAA